MEVNGRFWGSLQLATDSGVNFPRLLADLAMDGSPRAAGYREGIVLRWWLGDLVRTLRVLRGRPRGFPGEFPRRASALRDFLGPQPPGTRNEIFRRDDPLPGLAEIASTLARRL
jgi:predicted ATP-grasp superfamily ATP-dependent carboligase